MSYKKNFEIKHNSRTDHPVHYTRVILRAAIGVSQLKLLQTQNSCSIGTRQKAIVNKYTKWHCIHMFEGVEKGKRLRKNQLLLWLTCEYYSSDGDFSMLQFYYRRSRTNLFYNFYYSNKFKRKDQHVTC